MLLFLLCLLLILFFTFIYLYVQRHQIKRITKTLQKINTQKLSDNTRLYLTSPDRIIGQMIGEINQLLEDQQQRTIAFQNNEQRIRRQIANISHDLRTPLTSILGYTQLLKSTALSEEERLDFTQIIEKKASALQTLLLDFYDLSRIESNEYPLHLEQTAIDAVFTQVLASFYNDFIQADIEPVIQIPDSLPPVISDSRALTRIFTNIIQNILKHGQNPVEISFSVIERTLIVRFSNPAGSLTENDITQIFDRFYTADQMRTGQNTGLGLCIVKHLCHTLGHAANADIHNGIFVLTLSFNLM